MISALHKIYNKIRQTGEWPIPWTQSLIITQGCQNVPATGAIAGYSEVFAGCKLLEKSEK